MSVFLLDKILYLCNITKVHYFLYVVYFTRIYESLFILIIHIITVILIVEDTNMFCYIMLMYEGQNMLRRLRNLTDGGNQQHSGTINDSQSFLIHSLMDRVLKRGDAIAEMEATLVGIKNSLDAFKSVI